jgi:hypothetical protein
MATDQHLGAAALSAPGDERRARRVARDENRVAHEEIVEGMIPGRAQRLSFEGPIMRVVATAGIVGIAVVTAAIMGSQDSAGWLIGLTASLVSIVLAAVMWSSVRV